MIVQFNQFLGKPFVKVKRGKGVQRKFGNYHLFKNGHLPVENGLYIRG